MDCSFQSLRAVSNGMSFSHDNLPAGRLLFLECNRLEGCSRIPVAHSLLLQETQDQKALRPWTRADTGWGWLFTLPLPRQAHQGSMESRASAPATGLGKREHSKDACFAHVLGTPRRRWNARAKWTSNPKLVPQSSFWEKSGHKMCPIQTDP